MASSSQYATREGTVHSEGHHSHWQHQHGNKKNILLQEDVNHFCASTNFANLDPTSQRDLTSFSFCLKKSYHAYRMCLRNDGNMCLNILNSLEK